MKIAAMIRGILGAASLAAAIAGCAATFEPADGPSDAADERVLPDVAAYRVADCGIDEVRERICGALTSPVDATADAPFWDCPAEPKELQSAGPTMLFYANTKKLGFDRIMTLRYRDELNANCGEETERKGQCCYSRCTPMPVAGYSTRGEIPRGYQEKERCIDAPQGGTLYPASDYPECPAALAYGLGPVSTATDPFDAPATAHLRARQAEFFADIPRCCYRALEPID